MKNIVELVILQYKVILIISGSLVELTSWESWKILKSKKCKIFVVTIKGEDSRGKITTLLKLKLEDRNLGYKIGELCHNYWVSYLDISIKEEED